jgi:hypothetical protein
MQEYWKGEIPVEEIINDPAEDLHLVNTVFGEVTL